MDSKVEGLVIVYKATILTVAVTNQYLDRRSRISYPALPLSACVSFVRSVGTAAVVVVRSRIRWVCRWVDREKYTHTHSPMSPICIYRISDIKKTCSPSPSVPPSSFNSGNRASKYPPHRLQTPLSLSQWTTWSLMHRVLRASRRSGRSTYSSVRVLQEH